VDQLEHEALEIKEKSPLPERVDRKEISGLVSEAYREHWNCSEQRKRTFGLYGQ
jgi:hypothetical protein